PMIAPGIPRWPGPSGILRRSPQGFPRWRAGSLVPTILESAATTAADPRGNRHGEVQAQVQYLAGTAIVGGHRDRRVAGSSPESDVGRAWHRAALRDLWSPDCTEHGGIRARSTDRPADSCGPGLSAAMATVLRDAPGFRRGRRSVDRFA